MNRFVKDNTCINLPLEYRKEFSSLFLHDRHQYGSLSDSTDMVFPHSKLDVEGTKDWSLESGYIHDMIKLPKSCSRGMFSEPERKGLEKL